MLQPSEASSGLLRAKIGVGTSELVKNLTVATCLAAFKGDFYVGGANGLLQSDGDNKGSTEIIHGKGTGAVRKLVHELLSADPPEDDKMTRPG